MVFGKSSGMKEPLDLFVAGHKTGRTRAFEYLRLTDEEAADRLRETLQVAVDEAAKLGFVVTVEQVAQKPLAMRNYKSVVSVRLGRK